MKAYEAEILVPLALIDVFRQAILLANDSMFCNCRSDEVELVLTESCSLEQGDASKFFFEFILVHGCDFGRTKMHLQEVLHLSLLLDFVRIVSMFSFFQTQQNIEEVKDGVVLQKHLIGWSFGGLQLFELFLFVLCELDFFELAKSLILLSLDACFSIDVSADSHNDQDPEESESQDGFPPLYCVVL